MSTFDPKAAEAKRLELEENARLRAEAVAPMVDALWGISLKLDTVNMLLMTQNDLLSELIKSTR